MLALLYPGQGAQSAGFLHRLPAHPTVATTIEEASDLLSLDVAALDSADALRSSVAVQITLVVAGVATQRRLADAGIEGDLHAGLSVGAYAAAVGCGAISFADALRMVRQRAWLMERAYPSGYGLSAIEGLSEAQVETLIETTRRDALSRVYVANVNAPRQIVVAGSDAALDAFNEAAHRAGAHRARRLGVWPRTARGGRAAAVRATTCSATCPRTRPTPLPCGSRRARFPARSWCARCRRSSKT